MQGFGGRIVQLRISRMGNVRIERMGKDVSCYKMQTMDERRVIKDGWDGWKDGKDG